jgi:hypothetical protein
MEAESEPVSSPPEYRGEGPLAVPRLHPTELFCWREVVRPTDRQILSRKLARPESPSLVPENELMCHVPSGHRSRTADDTDVISRLIRCSGTASRAARFAEGDRHDEQRNQQE